MTILPHVLPSYRFLQCAVSVRGSQLEIFINIILGQGRNLSIAREQYAMSGFYLMKNPFLLRFLVFLYIAGIVIIINNNTAILFSI